MTGQRVLFICALSAAFGLSLCQTIISKPYNQSESDSRCKDGLISDVDTVVFNYEVDLKNEPNVNDVYFQTKKMDDIKYNFLCHIDIAAQCNHAKKNDNCVCRTLKDDVMEIKVSIKAHISYNGASLRGNIVNQKSSHQIRSEDIWFPKISESTNTQGRLTINEKEISDEENCSEHVKKSDLMITYSCISPAAPCVIEISADESTQTVQGNGTVIYYEKFNKSQEITATITRAACTLLGKKRITTCKIKIEIDIHVEKDNPLPGKDFFPVGFYNTIILIAVTILAMNVTYLAFFLFKKLKIGSKLFILKKRFICKNRSSERQVNKAEKAKLISNEEFDVSSASDPQEELKHCKRNPDHAGFKALSVLTLTDLPTGYQDEDLFQLIKTIADLTVLLTVKEEGNTNSAFTGYVGNVVKYELKDKKKCPCNKCNLNHSRATTWGEIFVYTSNCLALSNCNDKSIQCQLFFDKPTDDVKRIYGYGIDRRDKNCRKCQVKCVTCDLELLDQLMSKKQDVLNINSKINQKFKYPIENLKLSKDEKRRTIIVSHIHGVEKYVSFGHWIKREVMNEMNGNIELTKYSYNAPTCPGSAGAYVYILGRDHGGWLFQHHHIGLNENGLGHSGHGIDRV